MRRTVPILGILLIAAVIIISGSAVGWVYAGAIYFQENTTNISEILDAPDDVHATLGQNPSSYGSVILDLGAGNKIPYNTEFTVFATGGRQFNNYLSEDYEVTVGVDTDAFEVVGSDDDQSDHVFTTPNKPPNVYRYILIVGYDNGGIDYLYDTNYGPEVDAVGWDK